MRNLITYDQALKLLPDGEIHTFRQASIVIIGACGSREHILKKIKKHEDTLTLTGEQACKMSHGLAILDKHGPLFIETKKDLFIRIKEIELIKE